MPTPNELLRMNAEIVLYINYKTHSPEMKTVLRRQLDRNTRILARMAGVDPASFWADAPARYRQAATDLRKIDQSIRSDARALNQFAGLLDVVGNLLRIFV